jgi:phosphoribosylglycinamide formyltransferase-1
VTDHGKPRRVVVLISGRGSNMQALIEQSRGPAAAYEVSQVFSDKPDAPGLAIARALGVDAQALDPREYPDRAAYDRALAERVRRCSPSLIALAGFMRILSAEFVGTFEGQVLNIHPSLLPKYAGLHTHRRALAAHDAEHGATVHYVTEQLDGGPAVIQGRVAILPDDDEQTLAARVQSQEHRIYPLAVSWHCRDRLRYADGRAWLDGIQLRAPVQFESTGGRDAA